MQWQETRSSMEQVTTNMTGSPYIWMFCFTIDHKTVATIFLIYCKNITNFLFWVLWTCTSTSIKKDDTNLQKLWRLSACQKWPPFLISFLRYCEDIANLLLWVIWECLIISINNDHINLVGNLDDQSVEINF